jgi:transposase
MPPIASRLTPHRPWQRMSDTEWLALMPYVERRSGPGRPLRELRTRMDGIFHLATTTTAPWHALPAEFGKADTVSRYFRRLTHAGLWQRLLHALAEAPENHPLRALEAWICRACRRAWRILGLGFILMVRRLGLRTAMPGPPWMLPNPDLSETLLRYPIPRPDPAKRGSLTRCRDILRSLRHCLRVSAGRRSLPRFLRLAWS